MLHSAPDLAGSVAPTGFLFPLVAAGEDKATRRYRRVPHGPGALFRTSRTVGRMPVAVRLRPV
jgi:hypothetical protein